MDSVQEVKKYLLSKYKEVTNKLNTLDDEDSSSFEVAPEPTELGTSSWQADTDSTKQAIKQRLLDFAQKIQTTLLKLQKGTYGLCEKCKKNIEKDRLEIMPTASLCISCVN